METRILADAAHGGAEKQRLVEATLLAGEATSRHYHRETEEFYFVLSGSGEMELDGDRSDVGPGDTVVIRPGVWHQLHAGSDGVRILCGSAPPYRPEDTFYE